MEITFLGLLILFFIIVIITWFIITYNNFQNYIIRIDEAEAHIDSILRKRFDLLSKSINVIETHTKEKDILKDINKLKTKKISNFDLDRKLYDSINEFNLFKEKFPDLKQNDSFVKVDSNLNNSEIEIIASRKYYNDIISEYNKLVKSFPSNLVAFIYKYKYRNYYDDKDMQDEIKNDFKL